MINVARLGNDLHTGAKALPVVQRRRTWLVTAVVLAVLSVLLLPLKGINAGIEFEGGSQFTITGTETLAEQPAHDAVSELDQVARVTTVGSDAIRVQTQELNSDETRELSERLAEGYDVPPEDVTSSFIGPTWGKDITRQAIQGLVIFLALVAAVLSIYFRNWQMSLAALLALLHDLLVTMGVYSLVGWEVTPATIIGLLTILGYSLYDTVVVFDKVRENTAGLFQQHDRTYGELSNLAINQTLFRSINTSLTSLLPVGAILFLGALMLGAGTLRDIALALFIGMFVSTLSSIFIAGPLQVALRLRDVRHQEHTEQVMARRDRDTEPGQEGQIPTVVAGHHRGQRAQPRRKKGQR